ncbi:MAG: hypothetical protein ACHQKY_18645 [Terriglobia bacterium]
MKRLVLIVGLLVCLGSYSPVAARGPKHYSKETTVDMSAKKAIFLGWVDLSPEGWSLWGYGNKGEWEAVIVDLNHDFQSSCQGQYLAGRTVTVAKDRNDENAAGNDLYVKFSDVGIDHNYYGIRLSIHFIDPKTNTEIASIPSRLYYEKRWFKFQLYMRAALDEVGGKIQAEVTGELKKK